MRIALVSSWYRDVSGGSGTAVFYQAFVGGLKQRGYDIDVISPKFTSEGYVEVTLERFLFNTELRTDPRIQAADVVIGFDYDGYGLDPVHNPPLICSAHAVFADVLNWETDPVRTMVQAQAYFDQVAMEKSRIVTIGSQYAKDRIVALYGIAPEKVQVIHHGMLDAPWMKYIDAEPRVPNDHPVILSVGKMYPRKRTNILLRAIALLRDKYPTVELRVAGDGLEEDRLRQLSSDLHLDGNVTWLGYVGDDRQMAREWRQADIFAHSSSQETFGYVYLEAMRLGKPIVAARAGAAPEVLGDAGLLAEAENPEAMANALDTMLGSPSLQAAYSAKAVKRAQLYPHSKMVDGYVEVIERVVRQAPRRNYQWQPVESAAD
ncbi:MAG: glycosyltransferase family 4 protein [Anaerolineae bacterium]|nr:glycosyltransferase family 4 protein [Anaerolineae bacterium]